MNDRLDMVTFATVNDKLKIARSLRREKKFDEARRIVEGINKWLVAFKFRVIDDPKFIYTVKKT